MAVAKSWTISPDGLIYSFEIDPTARFHDGSPITADDVVYSFRRLIRLGRGGAVGDRLAGIGGRTAGHLGRGAVRAAAAPGADRLGVCRVRGAPGLRRAAGRLAAGRR